MTTPIDGFISTHMYCTEKVCGKPYRDRMDNTIQMNNFNSF